MVHDTDIVELELRSKRFSLAVRKKEAIEVPEPTVVYQVCPYAEVLSFCIQHACLHPCAEADPTSVVSAGFGYIDCMPKATDTFAPHMASTCLNNHKCTTLFMLTLCTLRLEESRGQCLPAYHV